MTLDTHTEPEEVAGRIAADVDAAITTGDWQRAYDYSNRAISRGYRHPTFFMVRAQRMEETGHFQFALEDYRRAAGIAPRDARIHVAIGLCAMKLEKFEDAIAAFAAALELEPDVAAVHYRHGIACAKAGDHTAAQSSYEKALALEPKFPDAMSSLASILARKADPQRARRLASEALALDPGQTTAVVALAIADMSERRYAEAEARISEMLRENALSPEARPTALGVLGDAIDAQKRYADAFAVYARENEECRRLYASRYSGNPGAEAARRLISYFEPSPAARWKAPDDGGAPEGAAAEHVFLLGFMRSGTTLLEQVLASNPRILALEEKGLLNSFGETYLTSIPGLERLAVLSGSELQRDRQAYWQRVREHGLDVRGKVFVDKQPLNTTKMPLIAKLFPRAKILFALRDPRDVVFSCYRRHFSINATMFEFLSLDDSARFYAAIMRLAEIYREKLPLNVFEHRYEAMVQDFDGRIRALCDFIGVEWDETMRNFDKLAPAVDLRSPSATQVRRPLYAEGIGQWRRYADQLAPILPILQPWVEKFGYPVD